jgi:hypothetical protein
VNALRDEARLVVKGDEHLLRPTFAALIAAEDEIGPLFALVERAGAGDLRLSEITALFWHCIVGRENLTREDVGDAIAAQGLAASAKPLRALLGAILKGGG